jgi:hypothetical protein
MNELMTLAEAIMAAISAGAVSTAGELTSQGLRDAYGAVKGALAKRLGSSSDVVQSIEKLERKPQSKGQQMLLQEHLDEAGLAGDGELQTLVQQLMMELQRHTPSQHFEQHADGDHNIQIQGSGNVSIHR